MITDDTRIVAYVYEYESHDGRPVKILVNYGYERDGCTAEEILAMALERDGGHEYSIMTVAEYDKLDREITLSCGVSEVDEDTFEEMLNVLPPLKWCDRICEKHHARVNEFCMSEFEHGPFTYQYARAYVDGKTRYYSAVVDYNDESTWIHNRI